jgi:triphosphatase
MTEVELKFELHADEEAAFRRLGALAGAKPVEQHLLALYFDTPAEEVVRHRMALRLRRSGKQWVQGLKAGASGEGGLHAREEWEFKRRDASIDLALFSGTPLAKLPHRRRLHERLGEVFRVDMQRTTWQVELAPGSRVEVALDRGEVRRGEAAESLCEVEIECLEGEPMAVFDFASRLLGEVRLRPSMVTKARRGYRLLRGEKAAVVKARAASLHAGMSPVEAARAALGEGLRALQGNEEGALAATDPEYVHEMRSSLRRLRSTLRVLGPAIGPGLEDSVRDDISWLARAMGQARDWDVLATQTLPALLQARGESPGGDALACAAGRERDASREALREALRSTRYARFILTLARWLAQPAQATEREARLADVASRALRKRHRRLVASAQSLPRRDPGERHRLRIEAKRMRYAVESFASLYPRKRVRDFLDPLVDLQRGLGEANDAAVAAALIARLDVAPELRDFAGGWLEGRIQAATAELARDLERLCEARRFWKKS